MPRCSSIRRSTAHKLSDHAARNRGVIWLTKQQTNPDINLGSIGVVAKDSKGKVKTRSYGARNTGKGARVGMGIGVLAAVLSGGLTLIPTAIGGAIVGAAAGSLSRNGLGLTDAEQKQLSSDLDRGCAAILVMTPKSKP